MFGLGKHPVRIRFNVPRVAWQFQIQDDRTSQMVQRRNLGLASERRVSLVQYKMYTTRQSIDETYTKQEHV
jgi:hypothetical protein